MKKLLWLLFFVSGLVHGQFPFTINSNYELIWTKTYDSHIDVDSQEIKLTVGTNTFYNQWNIAIYLRDLQSADLVVQHKDGKTRFLVKNIKSLTKFTAFDTEPELINDVVIKKGEFRKLFLKRDSRILNEIIERAVKSIIEENSW